jgi:hypothetical protein
MLPSHGRQICSFHQVKDLEMGRLSFWGDRGIRDREGDMTMEAEVKDGGKKGDCRH